MTGVWRCVTSRVSEVGRLRVTPRLLGKSLDNEEMLSTGNPRYASEYRVRRSPEILPRRG
jgi:hypothetical protein